MAQDLATSVEVLSAAIQTVLTDESVNCCVVVAAPAMGAWYWRPAAAVKVERPAGRTTLTAARTAVAFRDRRRGCLRRGLAAQLGIAGNSVASGLGRLAGLPGSDHGAIGHFCLAG